MLLTFASADDHHPGRRNGFVGRVLTRHVGLKPDLQEFAHKFRQE